MASSFRQSILRAARNGASSGSSSAIATPRSRAVSSVATQSSSSSSSRANKATGLFALGATSVALSLVASKKIQNDSESSKSAPLKRLSFADRSKANKGGVILIPRNVEVEIEEVEEEEAEELEAAALESEGVDTIAAVVSEDVGEDDSDQQGAYDPSTGKINWDCPCLGGMAHGPCGEQFKDAFSCFIYSEGEPKGIECVDKFKVMQDCFRAHPDVYKEELEMDEQDEVNALVAETETALGIQQTLKETIIDEQQGIAQAQQ
ncbi:unnamed protein product [Sympodiomycopsis kandeliae]